MKLFSLTLSKHKFIVIITSAILEIISLIVIFINYKPIYLKIFDQIKEISVEKAINITNSINEVFGLAFFRAFLDMKTMGKHQNFFVKEEINPNSKYYDKIFNNDDKHIVYGTIEDLQENFNEYYDYNTKKFLFLENYYKMYIENNNNVNQMDILNNLMNNSLHPELNCIAYYRPDGNIDEIETNLQKKAAVKYLTSILKTNFINRFLIKREDLELIHYFLLINDEMYIYPPEAYNNTIIYTFIDEYDCVNYSFPSCFYYEIDYYNYEISTALEVWDYNYPLFPLSTFYKGSYYMIQCLTIPLDESLDPGDLSLGPKMCAEINMTKLFFNRMFKQKEVFHFTFFFQLDGDLPILFSDDIEMIPQIKKVFNEPKFEKYYVNEYTNDLFLFQLLYLDLFKEPSLLEENNITLDDIFEEYYIITNKVNEGIEAIYYTDDKYFVVEAEKTICKSNIYHNGKKCTKDNILIIVYPLSNQFNFMGENFYDSDFAIIFQLYYSMTIIDNNYEYFKWKINTIIIIKILKLFFFFVLTLICLFFLYFIFVQIFFEHHFNAINKIISIIKSGSLFEIKDKNEIIQKKEKIQLKANNKEMLELKNLFNFLIKTQLLKINLEQNKQYFNKKISKLEENINKKQNKIMSTNSKIETLNDYMILIKNINNEEITIIFSFIIAYEHFKRGLYQLSKKEFKDLIKEFKIYENKVLTILENNDSKLKESISRCSKISYLNEYSLTNELSESILHIIKIKLLSQKIYYLYALSIFNLEKLHQNSDKKYNNKENIRKYEESIKYFIESKKISALLGLDTIRLIFSLIMISKCYLELKNYKESMININEALLYFSDLRKAFKDKQYFNSKALIFIYLSKRYIFQIINFIQTIT